MENKKGKWFEEHIGRNLSHIIPGLKLVSRQKRINSGRIVDIYAKDETGKEYYIEVKDTNCNRLNIGQAVEYKAELETVNPNAKVMLICKRVDAPIKKMLKKMGIEVLTFVDLGIPDKFTQNESVTPPKQRLSPIEQDAYFALLRRGAIIAKIEDLSSALGLSRSYAKNVLSKLAKRGAAHRVGRGRYAIIPADVMYGRKSYIGDSFVLASELMKESEYYVAYQSAAHIHGIAEQVPFRTTVAVLKQKRQVNFGNVQINFVKLKKSRFFGFEEISYSNVLLRISDLEKTLIDCIDRPELCGGIAEVARTLSNAVGTEKLDWDKLVFRVKKFKSYALAQRLGFLLERLEMIGEISLVPTVLDKLQLSVGSSIYPLDIRIPRKGKVSKKWKVIENVHIQKF